MGECLQNYSSLLLTKMIFHSLLPPAEIQIQNYMVTIVVIVKVKTVLTDYVVYKIFFTSLSEISLVGVIACFILV